MSQPTASNPRRAAEYYNVVRSTCGHCTIVAADVLDSANLVRWLTTFLRYVKGRPRLWGLHNYIDANRFRTTGTETLLRLVRGKVWLTETGGITELRTSSLVYDEQRAARALRFLFRLADEHADRITRIYLYHWRRGSGNDFDAGLLREDGTPRPGYYVVRDTLARRRRDRAARRAVHG